MVHIFKSPCYASCSAKSCSPQMAINGGCPEGCLYVLYTLIITDEVQKNENIITGYYNQWVIQLVTINQYAHTLLGVHPCICNSPNLPAPDIHLTNTDVRALYHTCVTRWVGRDGLGFTCFSNMHGSALIACLQFSPRSLPCTQLSPLPPSRTAVMRIYVLYS